MTERLARSGSVTLHSGRTVKNKAINVLEVGAMRIAGRAIADFNKAVCSVDYEYLEAFVGEQDDEGEDEDGDIGKEVGQFFTSGNVDDD
jgi:hypothetical protein